MKYSKKGWEKRKKERAGYADFFKKHIQIIKDKRSCCEECGSRLTGHVSEIAHILPKSYFKSIATNDENVIYLCSLGSVNQCHSIFDDSKKSVFKSMKVYKKISESFECLEPFITEKIPYKVYERYTDD